MIVDQYVLYDENIMSNVKCLVRALRAVHNTCIWCMELLILGHESQVRGNGTNEWFVFIGWFIDLYVFI
jgi:hypothetical protein